MKANVDLTIRMLRAAADACLVPRPGWIADEFARGSNNRSSVIFAKEAFAADLAEIELARLACESVADIRFGGALDDATPREVIESAVYIALEAAARLEEGWRP